MKIYNMFYLLAMIFLIPLMWYIVSLDPEVIGTKEDVILLVLLAIIPGIFFLMGYILSLLHHRNQKKQKE